mmetsp:Transcript_103203/g.289128  ORF Transcript_103203/g.289128 Transcript_103203/m.289128 type:complete len:223 (-) Transcript_103203:465-1133(-)
MQACIGGSVGRGPTGAGGRRAAPTRCERCAAQRRAGAQRPAAHGGPQATTSGRRGRRACPAKFGHATCGAGWRSAPSDLQRHRLAATESSGEWASAGGGAPYKPGLGVGDHVRRSSGTQRLARPSGNAAVRLRRSTLRLDAPGSSSSAEGPERMRIALRCAVASMAGRLRRRLPFSTARRCTETSSSPMRRPPLPTTGTVERSSLMPPASRRSSALPNVRPK